MVRIDIKNLFMKYPGIKYLGYLALFSVMMFSLTLQYGCYINMSESLPHHVYVFKKNPKAELKKGDYVVFKSAFKEAPITKKVRGLPGDRITVRGQEVFVNGISVGKAKKQKSNGEPLKVIVPQTIPEDCYFVSGIHEKSFDSRYQEFGLLRREMILGKAIPLC